MTLTHSVRVRILIPLIFNGTVCCTVIFFALNSADGCILQTQRYNFFKSGAVAKQNHLSKVKINMTKIRNFERCKKRRRRRARGEPLELKTGGMYVGFLKNKKVSRELFCLPCYFFGQKPVFVRLLQNRVLQQPLFTLTAFPQFRQNQSP